MSKLQLLNEFFTQRLTAAAVEIFGAVQEVMVEYQDEISRSKEENERLQRILDLVLKPEIKLHRTDPGQITISVSEEVPHEQQEWSPGLGQEDIEITQIKEEQEFDALDSTYTPWDVENGSDGKNPTMSSHEDSEKNDVSTTPAEQNKVEPDEEGYAASEPVNPGSSVAQSETIYRCDICYRSYEVKGRLILHMRLHTETPYHCTFCQKPFKEKEKWKVHVKTHSGERPYSCHICGSIFKLRSTLINHIRIHTGEKPYSCHICAKRFTQRSHVKQHMRIHTGVKPFRCHICGLCFTQSSTKTGHIKAKHKGEHLHRCTDCGKAYTKISSLRKHVETVHTGTDT